MTSKLSTFKNRYIFDENEIIPVKVPMKTLRSDATYGTMIQKRRHGLAREKFSPRSPHLSHKLDRIHDSTSQANAVYNHPDITCIAEYIKNKLYFATIATGRKEPRNVAAIHFFNIDNELIYNNFYDDFGPLNLACLYKYCCKLNKKLNNPANKHKHIVHYTSQNQQKRANAAYLITSYAILYLKKTPREAFATLIDEFDSEPLKPFQDASMGPSNYNIRVQDCLTAIHKASAFGFFNFEDFDLAEYEKYELMKNGDLNWMLPQKFLAFTGPSTEIGTAYHPPERYIDYFTKNCVIAVVRLNKQSYEASRFTRAGIDHYDMFMPDGSTPPRHILNKFLRLAETTNGPIAVHCKAGLGRTGSLIAAYLIKHYEMSAREAIAWMRICRPGSVIGHQQAWLESMENELRRAGQQYRLKHHGDGNMILHHKRGIYSVVQKLEKKINLIIGKGSLASKKREKSPDNGLSATVGNHMYNENINQASAANKISKPRITSIFGKLCMSRGARTTRAEVRSSPGNRKLDLDMIKCKQKINEANNAKKTQGDRLNEIKAGRNKYYQFDSIF